MTNNVKANRQVRNMWAMLTVAPLLIAIVLMKFGFGLWAAQTNEAVQTQTVEWMPNGFFGFILNLAGLVAVLAAGYCIWMAREHHQRVRALEARARRRTKSRHPTAIVSSRVGSS